MLDADVLAQLSSKCTNIQSLALENMDGLNPQARECLIKMANEIMKKATSISEVKYEVMGNTASEGLQLMQGILNGGQ